MIIAGSDERSYVTTASPNSREQGERTFRIGSLTPRSPGVQITQQDFQGNADFNLHFFLSYFPKNSVDEELALCPCQQNQSDLAIVSIRTVDAEMLWVSRYAWCWVIANPKFLQKDED